MKLIIPLIVTRIFHVTLMTGEHCNISSIFHKYKGDTVQLLVHGITYNKYYWDHPYVSYMKSTRQSTVAVDLIGVGDSCKKSVSIDEDAYTLNQVIKELRTEYKFLHLIGHSNGANVAIKTQSVYGGADKLVVQGKGFERGPLVPYFDSIVGRYVIMDTTSEEFVKNNTFVFNLRPVMFYYWPEASVIAMMFKKVDSTMSSQQLRFSYDLGILKGYQQAQILGVKNIKIPVLLQMGEHDLVAPYDCKEKLYWNNAVLQKINNTGHVFNMHKTCRDTWKRMNSWLNQL